MKNFFLNLMAFVCMTMLFTACGSDEKSDNDTSGNKELYGTIWKNTIENDQTYYGNTVSYSLTFGKNDIAEFNRNIADEDNIVEGDFTYSNGSGSIKGTTIVPVYNENTEEYEDTEVAFQYSFTISGNELILKYGLQEVTLTKE